MREQCVYAETHHGREFTRVWGAVESMYVLVQYLPIPATLSTNELPV